MKPKTTVVLTFADDRELLAWLMSAKVEDLKAKYPSPRYSAIIDCISRKVFVTDEGEKREPS